MRASWLEALGLVLLAFALSGPALSAEKVNLGTGVRAHPVHVLPILMAQEKGFFRQEGLEVEWIGLTNAMALHQAMAGGHVEVAIGDSSGLIQAISRGVPLVMVADLKQEYPFFFWVRTDSRIRTPQDLRGTRIATSRFGGVSHAYGQVVLKALGVEKEIKWVASGGIPSTMAALKTGAIDVAVLTIFAMAPVKLKGEAREILAVKDYLPKEWVDTTIYARRDQVEKRPKAVKGTIAGILKAGEFILKNPGPAVARIQSHFGYPEELAKFSYQRLHYGGDGKINPLALERVQEFLVEYGIVAKDKARPLKELYTVRFTG